MGLHEYSTEQRAAFSMGVSGTDRVYGLVNEIVSEVVKETLQQILRGIDEFKATRLKEQSEIAAVVSGLVDSPVSELESPLSEFNTDASTFSDNALRSASQAIHDLGVNDNPSPEEAVRVGELARDVIDKYGVATFTEQLISNTSNNSTLFSSRESSPEQSAELRASDTRNRDQKTDLPVDLWQTNSSPSPKKNVISEQADVIALIETVAPEAKMPESEPLEAAVTNDAEVFEEGDILSGMGQVNTLRIGDKLTEENLKYEGEEINIYRYGRIVTVTDQDNHPIFQFEHARGDQIEVHHDAITTNPELHKKFVRANEALATISSRKSIADVLGDKTHQDQANYLGGLAPKGSTALATASLITSAGKEKGAIKSEGNSDTFLYKRTVIENEEAASSVTFTVEKYADSQGRGSTVAISENGKIVHKNKAEDYAQLRKNYIRARIALAERSKSQSSGRYQNER